MEQIEIELTQRLTDFLTNGVKKLEKKSLLRKTIRDCMDTNGDFKEKHVAYVLVRDVWKTLKHKGDTTQYLHELLEDSGIYEESYVPPPRNPELVARLKRLQHEEEEKEYKRITKDVDTARTHRQRTKDLHEIRGVKQQIAMMANLVITTVGVFFFFYYATAHLLEAHWRVLVGVLSGLVALVAEMWMYLKEELFDSVTPQRNQSFVPVHVKPARPEDLEDIEPELFITKEKEEKGQRERERYSKKDKQD